MSAQNKPVGAALLLLGIILAVVNLLASGYALDRAAALSPSPTPATGAIPALTLNPGDFYFSMEGTPGFLFSRNLTGKTQTDFGTLLDWTHAGGSRLIRVHLTHGWWGDPWITAEGQVNEQWGRDWEWFFDQAAADGIYILPVFGVWADWNNGTPDFGSPLWQYNPLNPANGGIVAEPGELFQAESATQTLWMEWVRTLVERWQSRPNIAAWEIFSEINIASGAPGLTDAQGGVSKAAGEEFVNRAAEIIHQADPQHRPLTASLANTYAPTDPWASFYRMAALDFIEIHPYTANLDQEVIEAVRTKLKQYRKPVMIGESGLDAFTVQSGEQAAVGISHALWAGIVSGAMNGRALWSEDGYVLYSKDRAAAFQHLEQYATAEQAAAAFVQGVDFTGFEPLTVHFQGETQVIGGAIGSERLVIGWFRDALCTSPNWNTRRAISGQVIRLSVPGSTPQWRVDFYDTATGTVIIGMALVTRAGGSIIITLPDFSGDIAFKMSAQE